MKASRFEVSPSLTRIVAHVNEDSTLVANPSFADSSCKGRLILRDERDDQGACMGRASEFCAIPDLRVSARTRLSPLRGWSFPILSPG